MQNNSNKIFIIGLDGGTWDILKPFSENGIMPNLHHLLENGSHGNLISTIPPITAPAWASFITGKNPGKHGLFGFYKRDAKSGKLKICSSKDIKSVKIWNIYNYYGRTVGFYNLELTYPVESVNGFMIPIPPRKDNNFGTFPPNIISELIRECGEYYARIDTHLTGEHIAKEVIKLTKNRAKTMLYLYQKFQPDLMLTLFKAPDILQHQFWGLLEPNSSCDSVENELKGLLVESFKEIDATIGAILKIVDDDTHIFIVSDHGFGPLRYQININKILQRHRKLSVNVLKMFILLIASRLNIGYAEMLSIPQFMGGGRERYILNKCIDWQRTIAYSGTSADMGVFLTGNKLAKDNAQIYKIRDILSQIKNPKTGKRVFKDILFKEEIYDGEHVNEAPDILFALEREYTISEKLIDKNPLKSLAFVTEYHDKRAGFHEPEGIFLAYGRDIKNGIILHDMNIVDVLPNLLYLSGLPMPRDLDGTIKKDIFKESFFSRNEIEYSDTIKWNQNVEDFSYEEEEEQEIVERLSGLGYL